MLTSAAELSCDVYLFLQAHRGTWTPEYHLTSKVTDKGDAYSFGVLLLQICTGQRAILAQHPKFSQAGSSFQAGSVRGAADLRGAFKVGP